MQKRTDNPQNKAQAIEIKNLRTRVEKLSATRDDAQQRANYYWHLYIDERNQANELREKRAELSRQVMRNEDELGGYIEKLHEAAETLYLMYCGVDLPYERFEAAEALIVDTWRLFLEEGQDENSQQEEPGDNCKKIRMPF